MNDEKFTHLDEEDVDEELTELDTAREALDNIHLCIEKDKTNGGSWPELLRARSLLAELVETLEYAEES